MRKSRVLTLVLSAILAVGVFVPSAYASDSLSDQQIAEAKKQRGEEVTNFMSELQSKKIRIKALENQLNSTESANTLSLNEQTNITTELDALKEDVSYKENNIENLIGLVKVDNPEDYGLILPTADGQVTFSGGFYYDSIWANAWVASAGYEWVDREYTNQLSGYGNLGGYEGFTIGLNRQVLTHSENANVYDYWEGKIQDDVQFYQNYSNYGRAWRWQDRLFAGTVKNYNSHYGNFNLYFEFVTAPSAGAKTQHYGTLAHTWDETSINSIGVGPYSASVGWTKDGSQWTDADQWIYTH